MNWDHEFLNSALWLGKAYPITLVIFFLGAYLLTRWTRWGRQFATITGGYFSPRNGWRPLAGIALLLFFVLFSVRMNVVLSNWSNGLYNSLQALDASAFWFHVRLFGVLVTVHTLRLLLNVYLRGAVTIHWRDWLNNRQVANWLDGQAYYLGRFVQPNIDNPDQRIQQDVPNLVANTLTLALGLVGATVSIIEFTGILWNLSGPLTLLGQELPRAMVFLVYLYVMVATVFAIWIGRPLIRLNFLSEQLGANYRYLLVRVREYAENIAIYRGEAVEKRGLLAGFAAVIDNAWSLLKRSLMFDGYNFVVGQSASLFPLLVQAPRLFAGQIKLGDVFQTAQAFSQVEDALSFFRNSYDSFAGYLAILNRLSGFDENAERSRALDLPRQHDEAQALSAQSLTVRRPDGHVLLHDLNLRVDAGGSLLIRGPSGCGKTTLLRAFAGLWPYAAGSTARPSGNACLFLSQKPYLPVGSLRTALAYPAESVDTADAERILTQIQLGHLIAQLDVEQDWSQVLSPGEQQRLAFGRALAARPAIVFLDEATSATDPGLEHSLYALLRSALPDAILVSVGHRETLAQFHEQALSLQGDGGWSLDSLKA